MDKLGKRMKQVREEHNVSIYEMAEVCKLSHIWLEGIEMDMNVCPAPILISYAEKLGVSIDEIVHGKD